MHIREVSMIERRAGPRTTLNVTGNISIDEHCSLPCLVYDRSQGGVRIALPEAEIVQDTFLLRIDATDEILVCRVAWRKVDEIGALADAPDTVRAVRPSLRLQPVPA